MSKKILIIDDDLYIRELYEEILKNTGFDVVTAVNGEEGIMKLKQGGFDLVLLDMILTDMNGIAILDEINKNPPAEKNGQIILLSNIDEEPVIADALKKGATASMTKSDITPDKLIAAVKKYITP